MQVDDKPPRSWRRRFADAFRGVAVGVRSEASFVVHLPIAAAVVTMAAVLRLPAMDWALLLLCIFAVLAAEMFNTALERLAKAVDRQPNDAIRDALDISSGAVLLTAIGAAIIGMLVLLPPLTAWLQ